MDDLSNLSKEELIKIILEKQNEVNLKEKELRNRKKTISAQEKQIEKLEVTNRELRFKIEKLIAEYEDKLLASAKFQIEKFIPSTEQINSNDLVINEIEKNNEITKRTRKSPTARFINDLKELYSSVVEVDYDFEANGVDQTKVKPFGEDESYKIEFKPANFEVKKVIRKKYKDKDHIYQAPNDDPFPHSPLTASLAANLLETKFNLGVPFYRYSNYLKANGLNISESDICNYASRTMDILEPLYNKLVEKIVDTPSNVLHIDESPLKVVNSDKEKCYMYVYATSYWDVPIYIYEFNESRKSDKAQELLKNFKDGYIIVDGYAGYDIFASKGIKVQRCMVHARRYFFDVIKVLDSSLRNESPAYKVIQLMDKLFDDEAKFKKMKLSPSDIKRERNSKRYQGYIKELNDFIDGIDITNNTLLAKAVNYYKNHQKELFTYIENGHVDLQNNLAERVVKSYVLARRNFLFCKTVDGATTTGKLFSIFQTARANGLKSEKYISYVIDNINKKDINDLLPWSKALPKEFLITHK